MIEFIAGIMVGVLALVLSVAHKKVESNHLTIAMPDSTRIRVEWLRKASGCKTVAQMTSEAYALYDICWTEHAQGGQVLIRSHDGMEQVIDLKQRAQ